MKNRNFNKKSKFWSKIGINKLLTEILLTQNSFVFMNIFITTAFF